MRFAGACVAAALTFAVSVNARAAGEPGGGSIVVWPTLTPAGDDASPLPLHKPAASEPLLLARAQELDATLRDAVQDLGYTLDVADPGPRVGHARDSDLIARAAKADERDADVTDRKPEAPGTPVAAGTWVVSARLEPAGSNTYIVRIVAVPPKGRELRVRVETVKGEDVAVRGLVMLRDLISPTLAEQAEASERERERVEASASAGAITTNPRSPGRAVLAVNGGLFGGFVAYSVQRSSGSDDPRVLYPLLALGTGVGLGSALLVSDEWDLSTGDAWFLAAGAWWGAGAGALIANGQHVEPVDDRYAWGVGSGLAGLGLATFAMTRGKMDEGDAVLTHSGGAIGLFLGSIAELGYRGTTDATPYSGAGFGSAIGVVSGGALATLTQVSPSRVLLVDAGAGLGALAGAAAASPLLFGDVTEGKTRAWLAATAGGTLAGATISGFVTRDAPSRKAFLFGTPTAGVIGASATPTGPVPAYGLGWSGRF
jgi:hypothetical protein